MALSFPVRMHATAVHVRFTDEIFLAVVLQKTKLPLPGGTEGLVNMKVIDAAYKSARTGAVGETMKIAVIGGGSTYTPELVNGFLARADRLPLQRALADGH